MNSLEAQGLTAAITTCCRDRIQAQESRVQGEGG